MKSEVSLHVLESNDLKQKKEGLSLTVGSEITVKGWVRTVRNQKNLLIYRN